MSKNDAVIRYKTSMAVFKNWRKTGVIDDADLSALCTTLADKYGLSSCSIYLENDLIYNGFGRIYNTEGDFYESKNNEN